MDDPAQTGRDVLVDIPDVEPVVAFLVESLVGHDPRHDFQVDGGVHSMA